MATTLDSSPPDPKNTSIKQKAKAYLSVAKAAALMRTQADHFANPVTIEMGKLIAGSLGEVALTADIKKRMRIASIDAPAP